MNLSNSMRLSRQTKIRFTAEEDSKLKKYVKRAGKNLDWNVISLKMKVRSPRQCRERYNNYLRADLKKTQFSEDEDRVILEKYSLLGKKWFDISRYVPGRSPNSIRLRTQILLKRKAEAESKRMILPEISEPIHVDEGRVEAKSKSGEALFVYFDNNIDKLILPDCAHIDSSPIATYYYSNLEEGGLVLNVHNNDLFGDPFYDMCFNQ